MVWRTHVLALHPGHRKCMEVNVGYLSIIYFASIIGIDKEYYEAATIDGATKWKQMTRITIPLILPVITTMTLLAVSGILRSDFGLFYQVPMNTGALIPTTNTIDTFVYRAMIQSGDIGMSTAAGFYQSVVCLVLILVANSAVRRINKRDALFKQRGRDRNGEGMEP